jgi:hypothetical protein
MSIICTVFSILLSQTLDPFFAVMLRSCSWAARAVLRVRRQNRDDFVIGIMRGAQ